MNRFLLKGLASVLTMAVMFGTVSCSDDDDNDGPLTVDNVVGTYKGTLKVLQESIPNTSISLTKVSDSKINIELKNFTFSSIPVGDIKVECDVWSSENGLEITGSGNVTIAILGICLLYTSDAADD